MRRRSSGYEAWLEKLALPLSSLRLVLQEYRQALKDNELRLKRLEKEIERESREGAHAPLIQSLQVFRGISVITATSLIAEVGSFQRFPTARSFMAYTGLVPSEYSSGGSRRQGRITRTGNGHVRHLLIEAAWQYRHDPLVSRALKKRQESQPPELLRLSWKAQTRLHRKYFHLMGRGKSAGKVVTAVGRELAGFIWALSCEAERLIDAADPKSRVLG